MPTYEQLEINVAIHCSQLPVIFDSCQLKGLKIGIPAFIWQLSGQKDQTKKEEKSRIFFNFEEKGKKSKKLEKCLFPAFLCFVRYKYYSRMLLHFISKTNAKNIPLFVRKEGTFLKFP